MGLFKPAWMSENASKERKAFEEVERITDQSTLRKIAMEAPLKSVRYVAALKIYKPQMLDYVLKNSDEELAQELAMKTQNKIVRYAAFDRIRNAKTLEFIVNNCNNAEVRVIAESRMGAFEQKTALEKYRHKNVAELVQLKASATGEETTSINQVLRDKVVEACTTVAKAKQGKVIHEQYWESGAGKTYTYQTEVQIYCKRCNESLPHELKYTASFSNNGSLEQLAYTGVDTACKKCSESQNVPIKR